MKRKALFLLETKQGRKDQGAGREQGGSSDGCRTGTTAQRKL